MGYDAFISYSRTADGELAPALQRGLQRLARPWNRKRALEVFRDQTGLAVTPGLWSAIRSALDESEFFVLLACPEAAGSAWVNQEIEHWLTGHPVDRLLVVVTDGSWVWDSAGGDFDWERSTAVPLALRGVFVEEPGHLDLRWARSETQLDLRHGRFRDAVTELAAPIHGMSKEDLDSEDVTRYRRMTQLRRSVVAALCVLLVLVASASVVAVRNSQVAEQQRAAAAASAEEARNQQRVAEQQREEAAASAEEARRQQQIAQDEQTRAEAAAAEARRQQGIAETEQTRATQAAAEALRQGRIAQDEETKARSAAAEARRQQGIAETEQTRATQAAAEALRQERIAQDEEAKALIAADEAQRQRQIAEDQQRRAEQAAEQARQQEQAAKEQQRIATARQLVAQAEATRDSDPRTSLRLGIAARHIHPNGETQASLVNTLTTTHYAGTLTGHTSGVSSVAFSPDGRTLATRSDDSTVILWDMTDRNTPRPLGQPLNPNGPA